MSDIPVQADAETAVVDALTTLLAGEDVTVGVGVPDGWKPTSDPHIEVRHDGTPIMEHPVAGWATVSLIARAGSTTAAKTWASRAQSALCDAHDLISAVALTGVLPARDPDTHAELATTTVQVVARFT
jgi:hypothetical protein